MNSHSEISKEKFRKMGDQNLTRFLRPAIITKRSEAVSVTKFSAGGGSATTVEREQQIQLIAYRAVLRKLPCVLSVISDQLSTTVRKLFAQVSLLL